MKLKKTIMYVICGCAMGLTSLAANAEAVITDGSTSMEKLMGVLIESFEGRDIDVTYNPTGSGSGITAVLEGRADIGLSSRALKAAEALQLNGTDVAYDGIVLVVNKANPLVDMTTEQVKDVFTGKVKNWKEIGGTDSPVVLIGREAGSGTRDGFESITDTEDVCVYRQELTSTGDVITTVSQNPAAIGYASVASVKDSVKALTVDGVEATEENIKDGSYVVQRPFVLVTKAEEALNEAAQMYFDYITSEEANEIISAAGVVSANGLEEEEISETEEVTEK